MKKIVWISIIMLAVMAGCGSDSSDEPEEGLESGETTEQQAEESGGVVLKTINVQTDGLAYVVTGEAQSNTGVFYYTVEHAETVLEEETEVVLDEAGSWNSFEITGELPEQAADSEEPPVITLYGKDDAGNEINSNFIPIDVSLE